MLELLAQVDPMALPLWAVVLFAASMYPMGFMLGAECSGCCGGKPPCRNDTCDGFDLEEALSKCRGGGQRWCFRSEDLLSLQFTPQCFGVGSGGAGTVAGSGGKVSNPQSFGPIASVTLTDGGSGYAVLGRRAPIITLANSNLAPATITVNLVNQKEYCNFDSWRIGSVTVTNGGRGYVSDEYAVFAVESGGVTISEAVGRLKTRDGMPTLSASASPGTGANFTVTLQPFFGKWRIAGITVSGTTSGYVEGTALTFASQDASDMSSYPASAVIHTTANGQISSVEIKYGGLYWVSGILDSVEITLGGRYYIEDASLPAYVRPPTITVAQTLNTGADWRYPQLQPGTGALINPTVDSNPASPTFGKLTALTIADGGTNYLAWYSDPIEYLGDGKYAFYDEDYYPRGDRIYGPQVGCRVTGDGFSGVIIKAEREEPFQYEWADKTGCCKVRWTRQACQEYFPGQPNYFVDCSGEPETYESFPNPIGATETKETCDNYLNTTPVNVQVGEIWRDGNSVWKLVSREQIYTECLTCDLGFGREPRDAGRGFTSLTGGTGRWTVTVSGVPESANGGCLTFCGRSGLCGAPQRLLEPGDGYGPYGSDYAEDYALRRTCMRWLCRCYEGTGKRSDRVCPSIAASALGGIGAQFSVSVAQVDGPCVVTSLSIQNGGTGYPAVGDIEFIGGSGESAHATYRTGILTPTATATVSGEYLNAPTGSGAVVVPVLVDAGDGYFKLGGFSIQNGGSGYSVGNRIDIETDGETISGALGTVMAVNETPPVLPTDPPLGAITSVIISAEGLFIKGNGIIESVTLTYGGAYGGEIAYPNPSDWYTVKSTSGDIGGAVVFGGGLAEKLDAATVEPWWKPRAYDKLEHDHLFGTNEGEGWAAEDGDVYCVVYAFGFYGLSLDTGIKCQAPEFNRPKTIIPKDRYVINPCQRCSCN